MIQRSESQMYRYFTLLDPFFRSKRIVVLGRRRVRDEEKEKDVVVF